MTNKTKRCPRCSIDKPIEDFYKCRKNLDGLYYCCKICYNTRYETPTRRSRKNILEMSHREVLKHAAFERYGGYQCACCGETEKRFLAIDHIMNNGGQHRRTMRKGSIYRWLRDNNYPDGFQILCMNCNWGKHVNNGVCPHQEVLVCQEK